MKIFRIERVHLNQPLKGRNRTQEDREALLAQRQGIDDEIESLIQEQKRLKVAIAKIENILLKYEISPARCHGGKLNGVDCRELM
jgi:hypothetical protein